MEWIFWYLFIAWIFDIWPFNNTCECNTASCCSCRCEDVEEDNYPYRATYTVDISDSRLMYCEEVLVLNRLSDSDNQVVVVDSQGRITFPYDEDDFERIYDDD